MCVKCWIPCGLPGCWTEYANRNQTCAYLLVLLRCALTGAPAPAAPEGLDFDAFFDLARRQQVYNIVFPLLAALPGVPEGEKKRWENYTYTELTRTITMDHERGQLFARLDEAGIDYMPLKGLLLRELLPQDLYAPNDG